MSRLVILDNQAVRALSGSSHPSRARVLALLKVVASRRRQGIPVAAMVPTAVRVEAGWNRTEPAWAFANSLRIADWALDPPAANTAAAIVAAFGVSVADAHIGAAIADRAPGDIITVLTSDPGDVTRVAQGRQVNVVVL